FFSSRWFLVKLFRKVKTFPEICKHFFTDCKYFYQRDNAVTLTLLHCGHLHPVIFRMNPPVVLTNALPHDEHRQVSIIIISFVFCKFMAPVAGILGDLSKKRSLIARQVSWQPFHLLRTININSRKLANFVSDYGKEPVEKVPVGTRHDIPHRRHKLQRYNCPLGERTWR
ncbi:MAG: hypothetical protein K2F62_01975, partial [Muribaculaceae bacterium]|nr:hypothetical protein [Muribaculaceae bacterium]